MRESLAGGVRELDGLSAGHGYGAVIREPRLRHTIGRGGVIAPLGSDGAGKTTTLRVMCGLVKPIVRRGDPSMLEVGYLGERATVSQRASL